MAAETSAFIYALRNFLRGRDDDDPNPNPHPIPTPIPNPNLGNPTNVLLAEDLGDSFMSFARRMGLPG